MLQAEPGLVGACQVCSKRQRDRIQNDPELRHRKNALQREAHRTSPGRRDRKCAYNKRRWRAEPQVRDRERARARLRKTGWTREQFSAAWDVQQGICAVRGCGCRMRPEGRSPQSVAADHCWKTGARRELVCGRCNRVLGHLERHGLLDGMTEYVAKHR